MAARSAKIQYYTNHTLHAESDTSSIASEPVDETLYERILALQDMIPASTRRSVSSKVSTTTSWLKSGLFMGGKTLWVVSTSALLLGVPWALAYSEEQMIVEQERAEMMAQRAQNEVCRIKRSNKWVLGLMDRDSLWRLERRLRDSRWARSRLCRMWMGGLKVGDDGALVPSDVVQHDYGWSASMRTLVLYANSAMTGQQITTVLYFSTLQ
jgi:hypothetical protein